MGNVLFTNVRILDGTGAAPFPGELMVQGNRIVRVGRGARSLPDGERHRDRRRRRDADARHGRGAHAFLVERRGDAAGDPAHAARGARAVDGARREALPRGGIHVVRRRSVREGAARRRHAQRDQRGADPGPALSRREPGDHGGRRSRRRDAAARAVAGVQLRHHRQRAGGDAQVGAHVPQVRRRLDQAQPVRRQLRSRRRRGDDMDERRGGRRRRAARRRCAASALAAHARSCASIKQCVQARHRGHLPRELHRRRGARHARGAQGPALRRARHRDPVRDAERGGGVRHHAVEGRQHGLPDRVGRRARVAGEDAQARHPRAARAATTGSRSRRIARTRATSSSSSSTSA